MVSAPVGAAAAPKVITGRDNVSFLSSSSTPSSNDTRHHENQPSHMIQGDRERNMTYPAAVSEDEAAEDVEAGYGG